MLDDLIDKEFQRIILNSTSMWLNMLDKDANVIMWNKAAEDISGYSKFEVLGNCDIWELLYPDEEYRTSIYNKALEIIKNGGELTDFETTILCKDATSKTLSWNTHDMKDQDDNVIGSIAIAIDVTKIKANEQKLKSLTQELEQTNKKLFNLSYIDQLTTIGNRRAFEEKITNEILASKRSLKELSLLMIDIDHFKEYNDTYGHENGDIALFKVANQIKNLLPRKTDFIARYGGEEIVVILPYTPIKKAILVAENILQGIRDLCLDHSYSQFNNLLTISIGIASTQSGIDNILTHADKAMYKAKEKGRNRIEVY